MTPLPILVVSNHGEIVGGGEISLLALIEGLDRHRWQPMLVVPSEGPVAARGRRFGLPVHVIALPSPRRPGPAVLQSVMAFRTLILHTGACLVHANGSRAMLYAGCAGLLARRPIVWHVRIADPDRCLDVVLARLAAAIIVNSRAVGGRFPRLEGRKVRCVHNGVDLMRFSPRPPSPNLRATLGIPDGVAVVGSIGRFVPEKGFACLLEAARLVRATHPAVHWILVGDGELRSDLEGLSRALALEAQVHFTGWREDVPDLLALVDVFVLPSLSEGFGRVLVEAMALAKAVVATDAGGVPEIVVPGETGLLVPRGNATAMARAVSALLEGPARRAQLGAAGRRRVEAEFSLTRHVAAVEALYAELLDVNPRAV